MNRSLRLLLLLALPLGLVAPVALNGEVPSAPTAQADAAPANESGCGAFKAALTKTYNFTPSKLNKKQQAAKAKLMDGFWTMVKADPEHLLPCLRTALNDPKSDPWFRFDASSLLVELDPAPASKELQVRCFT